MSFMIKVRRRRRRCSQWCEQSVWSSVGMKLRQKEKKRMHLCLPHLLSFTSFLPASPAFHSLLYSTSSYVHSFYSGFSSFDPLSSPSSREEISTAPFYSSSPETILIYLSRRNTIIISRQRDSVCWSAFCIRALFLFISSSPLLFLSLSSLILIRSLLIHSVCSISLSPAF